MTAYDPKQDIRRCTKFPDFALGLACKLGLVGLAQVQPGRQRKLPLRFILLPGIDQHLCELGALLVSDGELGYGSVNRANLNCASVLGSQSITTTAAYRITVKAEMCGS
jgi:hypothetical protein